MKNVNRGYRWSRFCVVVLQLLRSGQGRVLKALKKSVGDDAQVLTQREHQ